MKPVIASIYLHVQVSNDAAKAFWEGNGFKVVVRCCFFFNIVGELAWES